MKRLTIRQKKSKLILKIAKLIGLEYDKRGGQIREDMQKLKYNTLNLLIKLLSEKKDHIRLFKHVTDEGAVYLTDKHQFILANVVIRLDGEEPKLIECNIKADK